MLLKKHLEMISGILIFFLSIMFFAGCSSKKSSESSSISFEQDKQLETSKIIPIPNISDVETKLKALGILEENDLNEDGYISVKDAFEILHRFSAGYDYYYYPEYGSDYLQEWYNSDISDETSKLDDINDRVKITLMYLSQESVIRIEEISSINLEKELSRYQALMYITRMLGNTYECAQIKEEPSFTSRNQTLNVAVKKGLVSNDKNAISDENISKTEFFKLIYRALYVTNTRGGAGGINDFKYISIFSEENKQIDLKDEEEAYNLALENKEKVEIKAFLKNDLSLSWTLPSKIAKLECCEVCVVTENGKEEMQWSSIETNFHQLTAEGVIGLLFQVYPEKVKYIRVIYKEEKPKIKFYYIDITLPDITITKKGEPLELLTLREIINDNYDTFLKLGGDSRFKKGAHYFVTQYENDKYRNQDNQDIERYFFESKKDTKEYNIESLFSNLGGGSRSFVKLQEYTVNKQGNDFIITYTPEPETPFKVIK